MKKKKRVVRSRTKKVKARKKVRTPGRKISKKVHKKVSKRIVKKPKNATGCPVAFFVATDLVNIIMLSQYDLFACQLCL